MKNYHRIIFSVSICLLLFTSCKKTLEEQIANVELSAPLSAENLSPCEELKQEALTRLGTIFANTATNSTLFKEVVYASCLKQLHGDFDVRVSEILELNRTYSFWTINQADEVESLIDKYTCEDTIQPIVFIPHLENVDSATYVANSNYPTGSPKICYQFEGNSADASCRFYILNDTTLVLEGDMYEEGENGAWVQDVWVM